MEIPVLAITEIPTDLIDEPTTELRHGYDPVALHELAQSIAAKGLLQPIGVKHDPATGRYRRQWGGRRLAAHRLIGRATIRAIIVAPDAPELDAGVEENLHRADLSPVEEADAIKAALDAGYTSDTIALRWHKSRAWVEQRLGLRDWPIDLLDPLHRGALRLAVAEWLRRVDDDSYRKYLTECAITGGATAAVVRAWVAEYEAQRPRIIANQATIEDLKARPRDFRVLMPCDACEEATEISTLRTYRVCPRCDQAIRAAQAADSQPARQ